MSGEAFGVGAVLTRPTAVLEFARPQLVVGASLPGGATRPPAQRMPLQIPARRPPPLPVIPKLVRRTLPSAARMLRGCAAGVAKVGPSSPSMVGLRRKRAHAWLVAMAVAVGSLLIPAGSVDFSAAKSFLQLGGSYLEGHVVDWIAAQAT